jgi:hypothetical protein
MARARECNRNGLLMLATSSISEPGSACTGLMTSWRRGKAPAVLAKPAFGDRRPDRLRQTTNPNEKSHDQAAKSIRLPPRPGRSFFNPNVRGLPPPRLIKLFPGPARSRSRLIIFQIITCTCCGLMVTCAPARAALLIYILPVVVKPPASCRPHRLPCLPCRALQCRALSLFPS